MGVLSSVVYDKDAGGRGNKQERANGLRFSFDINMLCSMYNAAKQDQESGDLRMYMVGMAV